MGAAAMLSTSRVNQASSDLAENWMPGVRMAMELRADVGEMRRWELAHLITDDPAGYATYEKRMVDTLADEVPPRRLQ
jgi:hypothetical protein